MIQLQPYSKNHYSKDQVIYQAGDPVEGLYFLVEGRVKLVRVNEWGEEKIVGIAAPGDALGAEVLRKGAYYRNDAVCLTACRFVLLSWEDLKTQSDWFSTVQDALARHIEELEAQLELDSAPVSIRIAKTLLRFANRFGEQETGGWVRLDLGLAQEDLATMVGSRRPTVTHVLSDLKEAGVVRGSRGVYWVHPHGLNAQLENFAMAA